MTRIIYYAAIVREGQQPPVVTGEPELVYGEITLPAAPDLNLSLLSEYLHELERTQRMYVGLSLQNELCKPPATPANSST